MAEVTHTTSDGRVVLVETEGGLDLDAQQVADLADYYAHEFRQNVLTLEDDGDNWSPVTAVTVPPLLSKAFVAALERLSNDDRVYGRVDVEYYPDGTVYWVTWGDRLESGEQAPGASESEAGRRVETPEIT